MIEGRFYTVDDLMKLRQCSKQRVNQLAEKYGFITAAPGIYKSHEVEVFLSAHIRTELHKKLGWRGRGLIWDSSCDLNCPDCGLFAVKYNNLLECVNGHRN